MTAVTPAGTERADTLAYFIILSNARLSRGSARQAAAGVANVGLVLTRSYVRRCLRMSRMNQPNAPTAIRHAKRTSAIMRPLVAGPGEV